MGIFKTLIQQDSHLFLTLSLTLYSHYQMKALKVNCTLKMLSRCKTLSRNSCQINSQPYSNLLYHKMIYSFFNLAIPYYFSRIFSPLKLIRTIISLILNAMDKIPKESQLNIIQIWVSEDKLKPRHFIKLTRIVLFWTNPHKILAGYHSIILFRILRTVSLFLSLLIGRQIKIK